MPQALDSLGQVRVVQTEAAIVLDDPQSLSGPVAIGVDDSQRDETLRREGWHTACTVHVATSLANKLTVQ